MVWVRKDWLKKPSWPQGQVPRSSSSAVEVVGKDFEVDRGLRHRGRVTSYMKWDGYGYIRPNNQRLVPGGGLVWVNVSAIQSVDRFPFLLEDMEVEFGLMKWTERGETTLRATQVTMPGGGMVALLEEEDSKKDFIGGPTARFAGRLKFFHQAKGFGYVTVDENIAFDPELGLPEEVCVELTEVNCRGTKPRWSEKLEVEFGIYRGENSKFMAYNMTLPGGKPITDENLLNREVLGDDLYQGSVTFWHWSDHWGFITIDPGLDIPERVQQKIEKMRQEAKERGGSKMTRNNVYFCTRDMLDEFCPEEGMRVTFNLYVDDKGAGATHVMQDLTQDAN